MALKDELNQYPKNKNYNPLEKGGVKNPLSFLTPTTLVFTISLTSCSSTPTVDTAEQQPNQTNTLTTPTPQYTPTPETPLTPSSEKGITIPKIEEGQTLAIGGLNWKIEQFSAEVIAQLLGENFSDWKIISDENGMFFNIIVYDDQGGYNLLFPHAPSNYQWDQENQFWINLQNKNEIIFPQLALPGGWNKEKQIAGPMATPELALMLKDSEGNIKIGIIYKKDILEQVGINPDSKPYVCRDLDQNLCLCLGEQKKLTLQPGQKIEAVYNDKSELLYHKIINPDGSWFIFLTSSNQVTNPQQIEKMFEALGIQIDNEITNIPYLPDEMSNNLGIIKYGKLYDGTYVAYQQVTDEETGQTKELIVAYASFNTDSQGNSVFKKWQKAISLENLAFPDPRVTNPELFDLKNEEKNPISKFANALKNAGVNVTPEQINQGITYVSTKADGTPLVDKDGNPFVVAVYNLDPSLFPKEYQDLAGPVPLMIAKKEEGGWEWQVDKIVPLRAFSGPINLIISNLESHYDRSGEIILRTFDGLYITWYLKWDLVQPTQEVENYEEGKRYINLAKENNMEPILGPIIYQYEFPDWVEQSNLSNKELEEAIRKRVRSILKQFTGDIKYATVVNEFHPTPHEKNYLYHRLGPIYVEIAFDEARKANPEAILIYNDNAIESPTWPWYKSTYDLVKRLKTKGLIDAVGMQGHFNQPNWTKVPSNDEFTRAIRSFRQLGLDVYITEMDISLVDKEGEDRFLYQAGTYYNIIKTYLQETKYQQKRIINFFGWRDNHSWIEQVLGNYPNADPLLIDDKGNPKLAYYAILKLLFETNLR